MKFKPAFRFLIFGLLAFFASTCGVDDPGPDTLTLHVGDSLLASKGKYDSIRIEVIVMRGSEKIYDSVVFKAPLLDTNQLKNIPLGKLPSDNFTVIISGYRDGEKVLVITLPFNSGKPGVPRLDTLVPPDTSRANRAPYFTSGLGNGAMNENEVKTFVVKAKDDDKDPLTFSIVNLDTLRALFANGNAAIAYTAVDSTLSITFTPGARAGNYPFRIQIRDTATSAFGTLNISVGNVNHPPEIHFAGSDSGKTNFTVQEGETLSLKVAASDLDAGDRATLLGLLNLPSGCGAAAYDTATGSFSLKPAFACVDSGTQKILPDLQFSATDTGNLVSSVVARITVLDSNGAPRWNGSQRNLAGKEGRTMTLALDSLFLGDAENDAVSFSTNLGSIAQNPLSWSYTPSFSDAGPKTCVITAQDNHRPPASSSLTLNLAIADSIRAVDVVIKSPLNGFTTRDTIVPVAWEVNGAPQNTQTADTLRKEGANTISRSYRDSLGGTSSDSVTVILDRIAPPWPVVTGPASPTRNTQPQWTWISGGVAGNLGNGTYQFQFDSVTSANTQATSFTPASPLSEGVHRFAVREQDAAGNWSAYSALSTVVVKKAPGAPTVTLNASPTNAPRWSWTSGGGGLSPRIYRHRMGASGGYSAETQATTYAPTANLRDGYDTLYVSEKDSVGWGAEGSAVILVDVTPPNAPQMTGPATPTRTKKPAWYWTSGGGGGNGAYQIQLDTNAAVITDSVSFTPANNLSDGAHTLQVKERDAVGNWSNAASASVLIKSAPLAPNVTVNAALTNAPRWSWTPGGGGNGTYQYRIGAGAFSAETQNTFYAPTLGNGNQTLCVEEKDALGWSSDGCASLRVDTTLPVFAITAPLSMARVTSANPVVSGTASDNIGVRTATYRLNGGSAASFTITNGNWSLGTVGLAEGTNTLAFTVTDSAGNAAASSLTLTKRSNVIFVRKGATGNGTSWANAYGELITVLDTVPAAGTQIWISAGSYAPYVGGEFYLPSSVSLHGGFATDGAGASLNDRNFATHETILWPDTTNPYGTGLVMGGSDTATGLIFEKGYKGIGGNFDRVANCTFRNFASSGNFPLSVQGNASIDSCLFTNNTNTDRGAIFMQGGGTLLVTHTQVLNNISMGENGGGLFISGMGTVDASNSTFSGNTVLDQSGNPIPVQITLGGYTTFRYQQSTCTIVGDSRKIIVNTGATLTPY